MAKKPRRTVAEARARTPKIARKTSERALHFHCQQWLEKSGIWGKYLIFHVPNERRGGIGAITHFRRLGVRPGVPDWLMFTNRSAAIELKDDKGKQRKGQEKFQRDWERLGHSYFVVRTLEEFQGVVTALILF
jgi:hypothetical protein